MNFELALTQWGPLGLFALYLIYDRQVLMRRFEESINLNTAATLSLSDKIARMNTK